MMHQTPDGKSRRDYLISCQPDHCADSAVPAIAACGRAQSVQNNATELLLAAGAGFPFPDGNS